MTFIKNNYKYFVFFIFSIFIVYFLMYNDFGFDATWEYGMSHAIRKGLLPYKDFNVVTTPLFIFLFSIGLFIKDSFFVFLFEFCILYLIMYYFLDKLLGRNTIYIFVLIAITLFRAYIPNYNAMSFVLIVIIMYLEKNKSSDKLIGLLSSFLILTKHTIGIPIFIISCIGIKDRKKIKNRLIGLIGPILVFIIYLLITNSYKEFFDLCFLGLISFGTKNTVSFSPTYIISIITFILCIISIIRDKNNVLFYYSLGSIMFIIPICDLSHIVYFLLVFLIAIIDKYNSKINFGYFPYIILIILITFNLLYRIDFYKNAVFSSLPHYEYVLFNKKGVSIVNEIKDKVSNYDNFYFIDIRGMYLDIITDNKISYFSVPLNGNHGYNGTEKIINKIKKSHNVYYFVSKEDYELIKTKKLKDSQLNIDLIKYVMDNCVYVDKSSVFSVYYKE